MRIPSRTLNLFAVFTTASLLTLSNAATGEAEEGTAQSLYIEALASERTLRQPGSLPTVDELRAIITQYEHVFTEFSRSPFADHALWQASGLATKAFEYYGHTKDYDKALRLLTHLSTNHPVSQFFDRVPERLNQLTELGQIARLTGITHESLQNVDRITIALNRAVSFQSEYLDNPDRWFVDFVDTKLTASVERTDTIIKPDPNSVSSIRIGRHPNNCLLYTF